jgi:hypothetical protein
MSGSKEASEDLDLAVLSELDESEPLRLHHAETLSNNHSNRAWKTLCIITSVVLVAAIVLISNEYEKKIKVAINPSDLRFSAKESCKNSWVTEDRFWNQRKLERLATAEKYLKLKDPVGVKGMFDLWNPEFDCGKEFRVGRRYADGGKWMCDPTGLFGVEYEKYVEPSPCVAYSVGSNFDLSFEMDLRNVTSRNCKTFTFDPTLKNRSIGEEAFEKQARAIDVTFKPWGLSKTSDPLKNYYSFFDIMNRLQHKHIDVFKIDCEGCEYESFEPIFDSCEEGNPEKTPFSMLLIELHARNFHLISDFFKGADKCGMRVYHKERNHWGCQGYGCVEYGFISEKMAFKSHIGQQCPQFLSIWEEMYQEIKEKK